MSCGLLDNYEQTPNAVDLDEDDRWLTLFVHGRQVSIEEGLLVPVEVNFQGDMVEVCFTDRLYAKYGKPPETFQRLFDEGFNMLSKPRKSDDVCYRRRRVQDDVLLVQDRYGIMLMEPSDWQVKIKPRATRTGLFELGL